MIISTTNLQKAKNEIHASKARPIIVQSQSLEFNRKILEYGKFDILLSPELSSKKDRIKQLDSGLNHVLAKIAAKNKVAIGIDLKSLREIKDKKQKAQRIARIRQNIKICRKSLTRLTILNPKDSKDAQAFLLSLGASTQQIKKAI
ncbi:MAG: hypothetical protein KJ718_06340 [Nanoarchaeota archaeon]|nr:hypothetical protein [Nanoarchaeota archaeon]MBU1052136.1 hypothetical protein [Nanoarchaeota archaeon]MBU1987858.1 hypothetical protein [Nanoarchaeota archaeon]